MPKLLPGVHAPHRKNTAAMPAIKMPAPATVTMLTSMHIGKPATVIVKPGDHVDVGQKIAEASGFVSSPVHSGVSGTVKKIEDFLVASGSYVPAIVIESDGLMTACGDITPPTVTNYDEFISALRESGIVGLGGAGFPTAVKFDVKDTSRISEVIVNCAECEPYITSDTRTLLDRTNDVFEGISLLEKYLGVKKVIIAVESNKREAIEKIKPIAANDPAVTVKVLPGIYPQGGEKVMIYHTTGKIVPAGKLPIDVGSVVCNCTTLAEIARYIRTGMPLTEKCVTVDGDAVAEPKNVIVPIGTSMNDVFDFCGGFSKNPAKLLSGGPMMGIAVPGGDFPIMKNTNAILAFSEKLAKEPKATQCIHCGRCVNACPFGLAPESISKAFEKKDGAALEKLEVNLCMECGCCSFVCPAKRPLVQTNKLAKTVLRDYQAKRKAAEQEEKK